MTRIVSSLKENKTKYPSASIVQTACYEDYKRCIDTYDKIYEKINIALGFYSAFSLVVISNFDYTVFMNIKNSESNWEFLSLSVFQLCSMVSVVCIIWALLQLLLLMKSKKISVFDSISCRNDEIYRWKNEDAELWLIDKYTYATYEIRTITKQKQKTYDSAMVKAAIALITYAVSIIISKGV